jgi:hypothetical protein
MLCGAMSLFEVITEAGDPIWLSRIRMHSPRDATAATSRARCASHCGPSAEDFNIDFSFRFRIIFFSARSITSRSNQQSRRVCGCPTKNHPDSFQLIIALPSRRRATPCRHPADYENASLRLIRPSLLPPTLHRQTIRNGSEIRKFALCATPARCVAYRTQCCATHISHHSSCATRTHLT